MIQDGGEEQNDTVKRLTALEKRTTENEKRINKTTGCLIVLVFILMGSAIAIGAGALFLYLQSLSAGAG